MLKNIKKINLLQEDLDLKWIESDKLSGNAGQLKGDLKLFYMKSLTQKETSSHPQGELVSTSWTALLSTQKSFLKVEFPSWCLL